MRHNLALKRKEHNLKQEEIATLLEITARHYRQLEAGTSYGSVKIWQQLAQQFNVTIDYLLEQADNEQTNCNTPPPGGIAEAQELEEAQNGLVLDVKLIADIIDNGRIDCPTHRGIAQRLHNAIGAALG